MALTYVTYTAVADQTDFVFAFPYLDTTHVKCSIDGADTTAFTVDTSSGTKVVLTSGATAGETVKVYRVTPGRSAEAGATLLVDFQDGSVLSEADLDKVCQQLLYVAQEAEETGASSLPIDWDGNYDAQSKRIKSLSGTVSAGNDATTKDYVDGLSLYGGSVSLPQSWAKVGSDFTGTTGNCTLILTSPIPVSDNEDLFVVSLNGLLQRPTTDYTVVESSGAYTITLIMGGATLASGDVVNIMNFGVSRQWIKQPIKGDSASDVALTVQRHTDGQAAKLQEWVTEAATPVVLASVNEDGDAAFVDVTASGNAAVTGNTTVGGTLGVTAATTLSSTLAAGATTITGTTTSSDKLTVSSNGADISGNLNLLTGALQFVGNTGKTIRQIVAFTDTSGSDLNINDSTGNWEPTGLKIVLTPQTNTSTIIFLGSLYCQIIGDSSSGQDAMEVRIEKGNTAAVGSTSNGTTVGSRHRVGWNSYGANTYPSVGLVQTYTFNASPALTTFDLVCQRGVSSTDSVGVYGTGGGGTQYTTWIAIEIA